MLISPGQAGRIIALTLWVSEERQSNRDCMRKPPAPCVARSGTSPQVGARLLANAASTALDQTNQNDHKQYASNNTNQSYVIHIYLLSPQIQMPSVYFKNFSTASAITRSDGPNATINKVGKMKHTRGSTSFTAVFAAFSSTSCRRLTRRPSE